MTFNNGYYAVVIGTDSSNPLDSSLLDQPSLFLELQLDTEAPMVPRHKLSSVPYAKQADVAMNLDGGVVNATEISINGNVVLIFWFLCWTIHTGMEFYSKYSFWI